MSVKEWTKIRNDTYFFPGPCNVGFCRGLLIEAGDKFSGAKAAAAIGDADLKPKWLLNTHGHTDHFGGVQSFLPLGVELLATREQTPFIEQDGMDTMLTYGVRVFERQYEPPDYIIAPRYKVDRTITPGTLTLDGNDFLLEEHLGHSIDQLTIRTPDDVLFIGDILLSEKALQFFPLPGIVSMRDYIADLKYAAAADAEFLVPSHGEVLTEAGKLVDDNLALVDKILNITLECCASPCGRERVASTLLRELGIACVVGNFLCAYALAGSALAYLIDADKVDVIMDEQNFMMCYGRR